MCRRRSTAALSRLAQGLLVATVVVPTEAVAGGMEYPDLGTVAIGRGTAFVARADNPSAFYYNPAGLSKQRGGHVLVGANIVNLNVDYLRSGTGEEVQLGDYIVQNPDLDYSAGFRNEKPFATVSQTGIGPAPMLVATYGGIGRATGLAISLGVVPPSSFGGHGYPSDGPQRYNVIKTNNLILYPGIGVSYFFSRYLQLGATFLGGIGKVDVLKASRPVIQPLNRQDFNEDLAGDAAFGVAATDYFMPSGTVGVLSNPVDWLELGASVRLPVHMRAYGALSYGAPEEHSDYALVNEPNEVVLSQTLPTIVRGGARYIHRQFDIELDYVFEDWATLQAVELEIDAAIDKADGSAPTPVPDVKIPRRFRGSHSLRLGSDVQVVPRRLAVRGGAFYQTSAWPKGYETFSIDFPYAEQIGIGTGLSVVVVEPLSINVGYSHIFQRDVEVSEGLLQQSGLPWVAPDGELVDRGNTINNGRYEVNLNLFGLSVEGSF